jgi:hypothetical protein
MAKDTASRRTSRIIVRVSAGERRVLAEATRQQGCTISSPVRPPSLNGGEPIA